MIPMSLHIIHVVSAATFVALLFSSLPTAAQSGIDLLGYGGSLGGDTPAGGTGIAQVEAEGRVGTATSQPPSYFTLDGRQVSVPRRGEVYIIRWREKGAWRARNVRM